jgi:uncharacterized membrane protein/mono/diheme cytochrome c family protein
VGSLATALVMALSALATLLVSRAALADDASLGRELLASKGCLSCHSLDGSARQGPTFKGLAGSTRLVLEGGATREVRADAAYLTRAIVEPGREVVQGYGATMPTMRLGDDEVRRLVAGIESLASAPPPPQAPRSWTLLLAGLVAFVVGHFVLSSRPARAPLVAALGDNLFASIYSLVVLGGMIAMSYGYRRAPYVELWASPGWSRWVPIVVMPVAVLFLVAGFSTKSPTAAGQDKALREPDGDDASAGAEGRAAQLEPRGIVRVTRHPALWGFALWSASHLVANGDAATALVAGGVLTLSLGGMLHIDARRAHASPERWAEFAKKTSLVPFAAIAAGRSSLRLREIGLARVLVAAVVYVGLLHGHRLLIGVPALP